MRKIVKQIIDNRGYEWFETLDEMYETWGESRIYELKELSYKDLKPCLSKINHEYTQLLQVGDTFYMWFSMELDF